MEFETFARWLYIIFTCGGLIILSSIILAVCLYIVAMHRVIGDYLLMIKFKKHRKDYRKLHSLVYNSRDKEFIDEFVSIFRNPKRK